MGQELARIDTARSLEPRDTTEALTVAATAAKSGLFPEVRSPEAAYVILATGRELGLTAMQSLRGVYVVKGRPMVSADAMVAVVRASGLCESWRTVESTDERCTIVTRRRGEPDEERCTWTMADAKRAGLGTGGTWAAYPRQMLRHRCAAELARQVYSDILLGVYCEGEVPSARDRSPIDAEPPVDVVPEEPPAPPTDPLAVWRTRWAGANGRALQDAATVAKLSGGPATAIQGAFCEMAAERVRAIADMTALERAERWATGAPEVLRQHDAWRLVVEALAARREELTERAGMQEG